MHVFPLRQFAFYSWHVPVVSKSTQEWRPTCLQNGTAHVVQRCGAEPPNTIHSSPINPRNLPSLPIRRCALQVSRQRALHLGEPLLEQLPHRARRCHALRRKLGLAPCCRCGIHVPQVRLPLLQRRRQLPSVGPRSRGCGPGSRAESLAMLLHALAARTRRGCDPGCQPACKSRVILPTVLGSGGWGSLLLRL